MYLNHVQLKWFIQSSALEMSVLPLALPIKINDTVMQLNGPMTMSTVDAIDVDTFQTSKNLKKKAKFISHSGMCAV